MGTRLRGLAGAALGLAMIGGGTLAAGATAPRAGIALLQSSAPANGQCADATEQGDGQAGVINDSGDLLPQASITLDQAVAAAQGAASGQLGEVDLEVVSGELVFTVAIGSQDVQIDATSGTVVSTNGEDIDTADTADDASGESADATEPEDTDAAGSIDATEGDAADTGETEDTADGCDDATEAADGDAARHTSIAANVAMARLHAVTSAPATATK